MAWLCPIFPLAQIAERIKFWGVKPGGYHEVLVVACIIAIFDLLLLIFTGDGGSSMYFLCAILCCQLRGSAREALGIPGSGGDDCWHAFCCQPCTIIQMVGSMWVNPQQKPGCSVDKEVAYVV